MTKNIFNLEKVRLFFKAQDWEPHFLNRKANQSPFSIYLVTDNQLPSNAMAIRPLDVFKRVLPAKQPLLFEEAVYLKRSILNDRQHILVWIIHFFVLIHYFIRIKFHPFNGSTDPVSVCFYNSV